MVDLLWKIWLFHSVQSSQVVRMTIVDVVLLWRPPKLLVFVHQSPMLELYAQWDSLSGA